jgi:hypothetical protein
LFEREALFLRRYSLTHSLTHSLTRFTHYSASADLASEHKAHFDSIVLRCAWGGGPGTASSPGRRPGCHDWTGPDSVRNDGDSWEQTGKRLGSRAGSGVSVPPFRNRSTRTDRTDRGLRRS